jgi:hypothetical protein
MNWPWANRKRYAVLRDPGTREEGGVQEVERDIKGETTDSSGENRRTKQRKGEEGAAEWNKM